MRIDLASIMFNMTLQQGQGTPSWGTALGQRNGHRFVYEGCQSVLIGMLYSKIDNISDVFCPLGKGGNKQNDYEYVIAGLFNKIYVNKIEVKNSSFVMAVVKQLVAKTDLHIGRRILKYGINMTYKKERINEICFNNIATSLGVSANGAWFITDIEVKNQDELHFTAKVVDKKSNMKFLNSDVRKNFCEALVDIQLSKVKNGYNKYFYGAPGCGKSFHIQKMLDTYLVDPKNRFRVTFHPEYLNSDFVGQILPTIEKEQQKDGSFKDIVKYIFNPGPFTKALLRSYQTEEMVYMVVEELNRGNASAIFGDMFQLLDRVDDIEKNNFSESQYPVTNLNVHKYIKDELAKDNISYRDNDIVIPSNMTILATMNTSDQNVFTLDTAFKRRWLSEGISNDIENDENHAYKDWFVPGTNVTWSTFLTKLNDGILDYKIENSTSEDKRLGKYFVNKSCLTEKTKEIVDCMDEAANFSYKVLEYIWNDVCKYGQSDWFDTDKYRTLEELLKGFTEEKLAVFQYIKFDE